MIRRHGRSGDVKEEHDHTVCRRFRPHCRRRFVLDDGDAVQQRSGRREEGHALRWCRSLYLCITIWRSGEASSFELRAASELRARYTHGH